MTNLVNRINGSIFWICTHQRLFLRRVGIGLTLILVLCILLTPEPAHAIPPLVLFALAVVAIPALGGAVDTVVTSIEDILRNCANWWFSSCQALISLVANQSMLTSNFADLFASVYPIIGRIHTAIVIPAGNIILCVCMLIGLGRVLSHAGRADTGVSAWSLIMVFVGCSATKSVIDGSLTIMEGVWNMTRVVIIKVSDIGMIGQVDAVCQAVPDEVKNAGILLALVMVGFVAWLITALASAIIVGTIIARAIQAYVYVAYAPIGLAWLMSESTRPMGTKFVKSFLAICLAGLCMMFVLIIMHHVVGTFGAVADGIDLATHEGLGRYVVSLVFSLITLVTCAFSMFQCGSWARDLVGI